MNPIVLLHGALGSSAQLESIAAELNRQGRKAMLLNFSGHGGVAFSKEEFGIETFAREVLCFLNETKVDTADIFGYSMGGYVALWLAHLCGDRVGKIVTLGTKFDWNPEAAECEIEKMNPQKIEEKVPVFAQVLHKRHAPSDWKEVLRKTAKLMTLLGRDPLLTSEVLKKVETPTHILLGDQDEMADLNFSKQVARWLPFGKFDLLPNTPHPIEKVNEEFIINAVLK